MPCQGGIPFCVVVAKLKQARKSVAGALARSSSVKDQLSQITYLRLVNYSQFLCLIASYEYEIIEIVAMYST